MARYTNLVEKGQLAWAVIDSKNTIPENNDDPKFLCIHRTKKEANGAFCQGDIIKKVIIKIIE